MREFFRGWRRTVGIITLVMALTVFVGWMRSRVVWEVICFKRGDGQQAILVLNDGIAWAAWDLSERISAVDVWQTIEASEFEAVRTELAGMRDLHSFTEWRLCWELAVISLTLLSAYLILWKPRKRACPN